MRLENQKKLISWSFLQPDDWQYSQEHFEGHKYIIDEQQPGSSQHFPVEHNFVVHSGDFPEEGNRDQPHLSRIFLLTLTLHIRGAWRGARQGSSRLTPTLVCLDETGVAQNRRSRSNTKTVILCRRLLVREPYWPATLQTIYANNKECKIFLCFIHKKLVKLFSTNLTTFIPTFDMLDHINKWPYVN